MHHFSSFFVMNLVVALTMLAHRRIAARSSEKHGHGRAIESEASVFDARRRSRDVSPPVRGKPFA